MLTNSTNAEAFKHLQEKVISRYSERYIKFGVSPLTLGWDSKASQEVRFQTADRQLDFKDKTVLDVGCGFADFYHYLTTHASIPAKYTGFDINSDLLNEARQMYKDCEFIQCDILTAPPVKNKWDIVVMFGLLNLKLEEIDNVMFARRFITAAFELCNEALAVDMLSACIDNSYPKEDFVYYYRPEEMLKFALELTPHALLIHDYPSIPQREMMMILRKKPCK